MKIIKKHKVIAIKNLKFDYTLPMPVKTWIFILSLLVCNICLKAQDTHPNPVADFTVSNLCYGSVSNITNTSTNLQNPIYQWTIWQQGVSAPIYTSTAVNVTFQFPAKTTYTVELDVSNYITPTHFHFDYVKREINVDSIPVANFDPKACHSYFANLSCCSNTFFWDFGDGSPTSTQTTPVHTYTAFGNYTVTLIAGNGVTSDTAIKVISPFANILTGGFNVTYDGDTIRFKSVDDSLKGCYCDWEWDFGDGFTQDTYGTCGWQTKHCYKRGERDSLHKVFLSVKDICFESHQERYVLIKGTGLTRTYVYPSPIVTDLYIDSNEKDDLTEIKIVDCLGKRLDNIIPTETQYGYYIYMGTIPSGIYIVQLVFNDHIKNHKIVKE